MQLLVQLQGGVRLGGTVGEDSEDSEDAALVGRAAVGLTPDSS